MSSQFCGVVREAFTFENNGAIKSHQRRRREVGRGGERLTWSELVAIGGIAAIGEDDALVLPQVILPHKEVKPISNLLILGGRIRIVNQHNAIRLIHDRSPAPLVPEPEGDERRDRGQEAGEEGNGGARGEDERTYAVSPEASQSSIPTLPWPVLASYSKILTPAVGSYFPSVAKEGDCPAK